MNRAEPGADEAIGRLDLQRALFALVDREWRSRGSAAPAADPDAVDGPGAVMARHAAQLDPAALASLRLRLATALLHQVDRLQAAGYLIAENEDMA